MCAGVNVGACVCCYERRYMCTGMNVGTFVRVEGGCMCARGGAGVARVHVQPCVYAGGNWARV